ncbi:TRAF3-interacting protein 1-like isoform X2 [Mytilus trossulus]|uniref:TRAF3-interacting protein 1-like isoform X2 n=1 Tax=Mytilus trossulus TaxID=6551 RepID=UPI003003CAB6
MSLDPKIVKKTQDSLGKIIKKPPLTDKLLGKPPFRFLHDIMTSVIKTTGFMKGLFTEAEMNSENVKDRDSKVAFLQKAVDMVAIATKKSMSVKPAKIVAGHEPEKTNEFLQLLATAINANADNGAVVDKVLNKAGDTAEEPKKEKPKEEKKRESRDKDEKRSKDDRKEKDEKREKDERKDKDRRDRDRSRDKDDKREKSRDRDREERRRDREDRHKDKDDKHRDREKRHRDKDEEKERRRKRAPVKKEDTFAEFLTADDDGNTSCSSTDLIAGFAEDINKKSDTSGPGESNSGDKVDSQKSSRANRPRGAKPRAKGKSDLDKENSEKKSESVVLSEKNSESAENEVASASKVPKKKRKSGTKSRMAMRDQESEPNPTTTSPQKKPSKIPVKLDKEGNRSPPKSRLGRRRSSSDKLAQQHYPSSPVKGKLSRRKSKELHMDESWAKAENNESGTSHNQTVEKEEEAGKENEPALMNGGEAESEQPQRVARPTSAKGSRRRHGGRHVASSDEEDEPKRQIQASTEPSMGEADLPPQVVASRKAGRPSSARPAPPRRKEQTMVENEPAMRLGSGQPTNVIVDDGQNSDDEEDETFVVEETAPPPPDSDQALSRPLEDGDDEDHGGLVKKILETKKELEGPQQTKKTEIERSGMSDAQRRKQREQVQKEVDKLRGSIQTLTRSANPLGKIMDYVQEDLDSMQKELERWKTENKEHQMELKREKGVTDKAVEPLKAQLSEVDQAIKDQLDLIAATKSNIARNDQKIDKLLQSVTRS